MYVRLSPLLLILLPVHTHVRIRVYDHSICSHCLPDPKRLGSPLTRLSDMAMATGCSIDLFPLLIGLLYFCRMEGYIVV